MPSKLLTDYPWTTGPVIINAPMAGFAGSALAMAVTQAGGIGTIGTADNITALGTDLQAVADFYSSSPSLSPSAFYQNTGLLPIGIGLLLFLTSLDAVLPVLQSHPPAFLWLFAAPTLSDYAPWTTALRTALPQTRIWIQVGSASAAAEVARTAAPDVLVIQGSDAGGHGFARGASVVSLLPETAVRLAANLSVGKTDITLIAAGGIVEGRGAAAAFALGAAGVVMGTRFLAANETVVHPAYRAAMLATSDGALGTARAPIFDELKGPTIWPPLYDGRAIASLSYLDWTQGVDIEVIRQRYAEAAIREDMGFSDRAPVWAGAGVALVNEVQPAGDIVRSVREGTKKALREALEAV
ncbi:inosine monophosphate dehydrogenase [Xylaria bambusicola]|uniref:inosine monophosphate dehydrogenase n=1 Tax=Xylaria bambusicola TaxID=326684 RepID=UPI002008DE0B|nr:inosine monophosphate dehydrogenase [Xylaria bambusicola]KAI0515196.1 inosine monophosphate dehydrogenase [Xylaria bambusicola]